MAIKAPKEEDPPMTAAPAFGAAVEVGGAEVADSAGVEVAASVVLLPPVAPLVTVVETALLDSIGVELAGVSVLDRTGETSEVAVGVTSAEVIGVNVTEVGRMVGTSLAANCYVSNVQIR